MIVEHVDRAVAKIIAEDVLNERFTDIVDGNIHRRSIAIEDKPSDDAEDARESRIENETAEIDWDDI